MTDETPRTEAIWRVVQEPEDGSWTITDDTRPGFVVASVVLGDAVSELMTVMALWDQASDDLKELLPASNFREAAAPPEPKSTCTCETMEHWSGYHVWDCPRVAAPPEPPRPDVECASCGKAIGAAPRCRECYLRMVNKKQDAVDAARVAAPQGQPLDVERLSDAIDQAKDEGWIESRYPLADIVDYIVARLSASGSPGDDR